MSTVNYIADHSSLNVSASGKIVPFSSSLLATLPTAAHDFGNIFADKASSISAADQEVLKTSHGSLRTLKFRDSKHLIPCTTYIEYDLTTSGNGLKLKKEEGSTGLTLTLLQINCGFESTIVWGSDETLLQQDDAEAINLEAHQRMNWNVLVPNVKQQSTGDSFRIITRATNIVVGVIPNGWSLFLSKVTERSHSTRVPDNIPIYTTNSYTVSQGTDAPHIFALQSQDAENEGNGLFLAVEDTDYSTSDFDFKDILMSVIPTPPALSQTSSLLYPFSAKNGFLPSARSKACGTTLADGSIVMLGGMYNAGTTEATQTTGAQYLGDTHRIKNIGGQFVTQQINQSNPPPKTHVGSACGVDSGQLIVFGGVNQGSAVVSKAHMFTPATRGINGSWSDITPATADIFMSARYGAAMCARPVAEGTDPSTVTNEFLVFGGIGGDFQDTADLLNDIYLVEVPAVGSKLVEPAGDDHTAIAALITAYVGPSPRANAAMAAFDENTFAIFGGYTSVAAGVLGTAVADLHIITKDSYITSTVTPTIVTANAAAAVVHTVRFSNGTTATFTGAAAVYNGTTTTIAHNMSLPLTIEAITTVADGDVLANLAPVTLTFSATQARTEVADTWNMTAVDSTLYHADSVTPAAGAYKLTRLDENTLLATPEEMDVTAYLLTRIRNTHGPSTYKWATINIEAEEDDGIPKTDYIVGRISADRIAFHGGQYSVPVLDAVGQPVDPAEEIVKYSNEFKILQKDQDDKWTMERVH